MIIAIDGTVSSGKSTAAKNVARELGLLYINTGLMYRAVAAYCLNSGVDTADKEKVASLPLSPGVYIMKDKFGNVIYVGKAKKLKNRVGQYFLNKDHQEKVKSMVSQVADFNYILTNSE